MPSYEGFMYSSPKSIPPGVQVKRIDNIEEIIVSNDLKKCMKSVLASGIALIFLGAVLVLLLRESNSFIIFVGVFELVLLVVFLSSLKQALTKNVVLFNTTTRNFSMCRQWPFGRSKPQEFISGTATPLLLVTQLSKKDLDFSFYVSNCPPDYNFTIFDIKKFPTFLPAPMTRPMMNWMYQLIQAIQDRDITLPEKKILKESEINKRAMEEFGNLKVVQGMEELSKIPEPVKDLAKRAFDDFADKN